MKSTLFAVAAIALAACGSKSKGTTTDPCKDKEMPMFDGPLQAGQWDAMSAHDREEFMEHVVLPAMKEKFQAFDAEGFADFNCGTCHGAGAAPGGNHEMPNADLPVLTGALFQDPGDDQAIFEFMDTTVKPAMAELLGMPMKTETQEGFACGNCHTFGE